MLIGLAGAAGALCRLGLANVVGERSFPLATLAVNVAGSFVLGLVVALVPSRISPAVVSVLGVGFLGAFTTFSTFALDAVRLQESGRFVAAGSYVVASVALGVAGATAGQVLGRSMLGP